MESPLIQLADEVAKLLVQSALKIVFAESCTGGLVSATLARIPGISNHHCGSAVVYRLNTKTRWLGISETVLVKPGPVSELVAKSMAEGVLRITPEADISASITGHLGPNAPEEQDGLIFVGIAIRHQGCHVSQHRLPAHDLSRGDGENPIPTTRELRQAAATAFVLTQTAIALRSQISNQ